MHEERTPRLHWIVDERRSFITNILFCLLNIVNVNSNITIDSSDGIVQDLIEIELKLEAVKTHYFVLYLLF